MYDPDDVDMDAERVVPETSLTTPVNKTLESGTWTKSIIWGPNVPFKDFTQLEFNHEDDIVPEERPSGYCRDICIELRLIVVYSQLRLSDLVRG